MAKKKSEKVVGMFCNSTCNCGLLAITEEPLNFEERQYKNKHIAIYELEITYKKKRHFKKMPTLREWLNLKDD